VTEDTENLILRLLRDIRAEQAVHSEKFVAIEQRMTTLERKMDDVNESVGYALGLSAHANVAYETTGQRIDRLRETVDDLKARVAALETKQ
jgi:ubiquinone biosynthesis protein UbiJ